MLSLIPAKSHCPILPRTVSLFPILNFFDSASISKASELKNNLFLLQLAILLHESMEMERRRVNRNVAPSYPKVG
jgi:hypothetical protein